MSELDPIHLKSWLRFWGDFGETLSTGIGALAHALADDGVRLAGVDDVTCISAVTEPARLAQPHEEKPALLRNSDLEMSVAVTLRSGTRSVPWELGQVPLLTSRGTFIRGGSEQALLGQLSPSPGVFLERNEQSVVALVRPARGLPIRLRLAADGLSVASQGRGSVAWSTFRDVMDDTRIGAPGDADVAIVARSLRLRGPQCGEENADGTDRLLAAVRNYFGSVDLGEHGLKQLNRRLKRFGLEPSADPRVTVKLLSAVVELLSRFNEEAEAPADDSWDLGNLRVRLVGDFLNEARDEWLSALRRGILARWRQFGGDPVDFSNAVREVNGPSPGSSLFSDAFRKWSVGLPICQRIPMNGSNYVAAAALTRRVTFDGPGGIRIGHERPPRDFHWTHYGRLCPFDTPQSVDVGVTLSLAAGARISDLGLIEAPCWPVDRGTIIQDLVWLSPWDESDGRTGWIAFPDERDALEAGGQVYAHQGDKTLERVAAAAIAHIHVDEEGMVSLAANLIPYRAHNDAVRMNMACNFLRQALPLSTATAPAVRTGAEQRFPQLLPIDAGSRDHDMLAFGADLFVGYLTWKGWNHEDAMVVSSSAAEVLTSVHFERLHTVRLGRSLAAQEFAYLIAMREHEFDEGIDPGSYDARGVVKEGSTFTPGAPFLLEPAINWRKTRQSKVVAHTGGDGKLGPAEVHRVETADDENGRGWVGVVLRRSRRAQVGDKLANRHGHKGVISRILNDHEMPYVVLDGRGTNCPCGESRTHHHLQVLINPLSVISRTNLGQLFETRDARSGALAGLPDKFACYDPSVRDITQRKLDGKVLVGMQYLMKLDHNAEEKIHARSTDARAYSAFVQQPLGGRRREGGQRLGEMEVWALQAHGVPHLLQEMLTLKSDNPWSRRVLLADIATGGNEAKPELPEALRIFTAMCYGLGLDLVLVGRDEHRLDPAEDKLPPDDAAEFRVGLLDGAVFVQTASKGAVTSTLISGRGEALPVCYHRDGLESEAIFGPVEDFTCACGAHKQDSSKRRCDKCGTPLLPKRMRRRRMAHIELARPIPNPFLVFSASVSFDEYSSSGSLRIAFDPAAVDEETTVILSGLLGDSLTIRLRTTLSGRRLDPANVRANTAIFVELCIRASPLFRDAVEARLGTSVRVPATVSERSDLGNRLTALLTNQTIRRSGDVEMGEAIERLLALVSKGANARDCADQCADVVNELLRDAAECPVDFALGLLAKHPAGNLISLCVLPVIPPDLRRVVKLPRVFMRNDLTVGYQRVLLANEDLRNADCSNPNEYGCVRAEHMRAVSRLMCNQLLPMSARAWNPDTRGLRESLSSVLDGKDGLLVGHLLGKRVDFSGRAVIVPDPDLELDTCRLPFALAIKLYRPLLLEHLHRAGAKDATSVVDRARHGNPEAIEVTSSALKSLFAEYPAVLNRQPTLHRLGLLAFRPVLGLGSVIALPSMVTAGFNADFDGDQMAVYLPVTREARKDAQRLFPSQHLWRPRDGRFALSLSQDIALGMFLAGRGSSREVARGFESRPADSGLLADIEESKNTAFERATRASTSFSLGDLEELNRSAMSGDAEDMARILKQPDDGNPLRRIVNSGARGDAQVIAYLAGTVFAERSGSNLTGGLMLGERFDMARSRRRDIVNTKLATAEGGWLTKQLVAWAQHVCVTKEDCGTATGLRVTAALSENGVRRWIYGRVLANDCRPLEITAGTVIGTDLCGRIQAWLSADAERSIAVRSPEYCKDGSGVCGACYGVPPWYGCGWSELSKNDLVRRGTPVGLIAAQAAGEPGTQMALRRKHLAERISGPEDEDVIERFRELLQDAASAWSLDPHNIETSVAALDAHLVAQGINLSVIHLDTVLRGRQPKLRDEVGWIARLTEPGGRLESTLASAAIGARKDSLRNLRSQTVVGGKTLGSVEVPQ